MRLIALTLIAACSETRATTCDDGTFCPVDTTCGGAGVCIVDADACGGFADGVACQLELVRGRCAAGTCLPGLDLIGGAAAVPRHDAIGIRVTVLDHPEIEPGVTNENEFFGVTNILPDSTVTLELSLADAFPVVTRPISVADRSLSVEVFLGPIPLIAESSIALVAATTGIAPVPGTGLVSGTAVVDGGALAGMTAATDAGCAGPFYLGAELVVAVGATATLASDGSFVFVNCPPGSATLTAAFTGASCATPDGIPAAAMPIEVVADRLLWLGQITCE